MSGENEQGVPADFPARTQLTAIGGAQPKLAVAFVDGQYVVPVQSSEEIRADYEMCEDLAQQLVAYCQKKLPLFKSRKITLARVYEGVVMKGWCTSEQCTWVIRRTAVLLEWPVPRYVIERAGRIQMRF